MKNLVFFTVFLLAACGGPSAMSFADRVSRAEALEGTPGGLSYVAGIVEGNGKSIDQYAAECYSKAPHQKYNFQVIADVTNQGRFENVLVRPESDPNTCFARKFSKLRVDSDRPAGFEKKSFPIFINVTHNK